MNNGKCEVEVVEEEEDEDTEKEESVNEGKEDDTAEEEEKKKEGDEKEEENVVKENQMVEECDLEETLTVDAGLGESVDETALIFKGEKIGKNEKKLVERKEEGEEDEDESDKEVVEEEDLDTVKGNPLEEEKAEILNNDLDSDDDDDDEAEGKLVISEDSDDEEDDDMPAAKKAKLGDEIVESNDIPAVVSEDKSETSGDKIQTEASEDGSEKAAVFGFRFVNECLDEEAFEMEEAVVVVDDQKDVEVPVEVEQIDTDEVETLEKYKIGESTMEENVEMEENEEEEKDEEEEVEVTEKVPEVRSEKREKLLENVEEEEDDELSSESLASRWQKKKGKRFGQKKSMNKSENISSSKRPRRSCQQVKGYFGK